MEKIDLQIRFGDIDRLGHVNNSVMSQFLDLGRYDFIKKCFPQIDFLDKTWVLVRVENDFLRPIFEQDKIHIESDLKRVGQRSITIEQQIKDDAGKVKARSVSVLSTFDLKKQSSFPMPDEWRMQLENYQKQQ